MLSFINPSVSFHKSEYNSLSLSFPLLRSFPIERERERERGKIRYKRYERRRENSRPNPRIQKEQPVINLPILPRPPRIANFILRIVPLDQILLYTPALKQPDHLPIGEPIRERRDPAIGVDVKEPRFLLGVLGEVDFVHGVGEREFLERDGDLYPVRGLRCVEVDVWTGCGSGGCHCSELSGKLGVTGAGHKMNWVRYIYIRGRKGG